MIGESRKAIVAAVLAFLGPPAALLAATDQDLTWRLGVAAVMAGIVSGLGVWVTSNDTRTPGADG